MTEQEIIEAFQRGRRRANTRGWPAFLVGFVGFGLGGLSLHGPEPSLLGLVALFGGVLLMIAGSLTVSGSMRCPACNKLPMAPMGGGGTGLIVNPDACPSCGARLR